MNIFLFFFEWINNRFGASATMDSNGTVWLFGGISVMIILAILDK